MAKRETKKEGSEWTFQDVEADGETVRMRENEQLAVKKEWNMQEDEEEEEPVWRRSWSAALS